MPFNELKAPLPIEIVENQDGIPSGKGVAIAVIDYSAENHLMWVCIIDESAECWTVPNPLIRMQNNPSMGRKKRKKVATNAVPEVSLKNS